ncbi:biopolymer transport protein ExbD [Planctomycetes bacterium Pan216]|uniref:Biopolymer transport protein ExbD n=1 Tax=Kolteria novifilia TaxID=2527975 RepID=A0A518BAE2_9BACT|nr:biopolymer transport protein ExbD [Planctomycetes bacterium Pan216]
MKTPQFPRKRNQVIRVTPLIDVIFLLIIFFVCVRQYQEAASPESIQLPAAESVDQTPIDQHSPETVVVHVRDDGSFLLDGEPLPKEAMETLLVEREAEVRPRVLDVRIRADRDVAYRFVEPILVACASAGVWKVSFVVTPRSADAVPNTPSRPEGR